MEKTFIILGSILMAIAVALGAFGAHGLAAYFEQYPKYAATFDTAVRYHMVHALGLFAVAFATTRFPSGLTNAAGWLFFAGVLLFSGSLYLLVATRTGWLGAITPFGGVAFIAGWCCLALAAYRA